MRRVVVIGAGAAGWMAAIAAANAGARVTLLERQARPGMKLLATGGGRCNLTNVLDAEAMARRFGAAERFVRPALSGFDSARLRSFFEGLGLATEVVDGFHVFPVCNRAARVLEVLRDEADRLGVVLRCGAEVVEIVSNGQGVVATHEAVGDSQPGAAVPPAHGVCGIAAPGCEPSPACGTAAPGCEPTSEPSAGPVAGSLSKAPAPRRVTGVLLADGSRIDADAVVLCAGGPACAAAGGTPSGIELARRAGHAIVPPVPAGVPLVTREEWPRCCTGVRIEGARLRLTASARLPQEASAESHGLEAGAMRLRLTASARLPQEASAESHGLEARATSLSGPGESPALAARPDSRVVGRVRAITIETRGDLLFTHRGVSGPGVLDISGAIARRLAVGEEAVTLRASLTDEDRADVWEERLRAWSAEHGRRLVRSLVAEHLPAAVAAEACAAAGVGAEDRAARLTRDVRRALAAWLSAAPLTVVATEGMERAIVTAGGVARDEVAPRTLASHIIAGLHLAGEVLDVDGPCGGFNLTWAFASGRLAGEHAARG